MWPFTKKPIVLDCYTNRKYVYDFAPIVKAKDALPKWFKKIPTSYKAPGSISPVPTMRACSGFISQYDQGVVLPLWSDLSVSIGAINTGAWGYQFSDAQSYAEAHSEIQRGTYLPNTHYQHIKLHSPWLFKCNDDIEWEFMGANYNFESPEKMIVLPGVVSYKYQYGTNLNLIFPRSEVGATHMLLHGQPIAQLFPISERPLVIRQHLVSTEEFLRIADSMIPIKFVGKYVRAKSLMQGKCPFRGA